MECAPGGRPETPYFSIIWEGGAHPRWGTPSAVLPSGAPGSENTYTRLYKYTHTQHLKAIGT